MNSAKIEINIEDVPVQVEVIYTSHKATRGFRDSLGVPMEPDEDAGIEISSIILGGIDIKNVLPERVMEIIEMLTLEELRG